MAAKDILAELEMLGAVGHLPSPVRAVPETPEVTITLEEGSPTSELVDARGPSMVELCERAVHALDRMVEAQSELRDIFIEIRDVWCSDVEEAVEEPLGEEEDTEPASESEEEELHIDTGGFDSSDPADSPVFGDDAPVHSPRPTLMAAPPPPPEPESDSAIFDALQGLHAENTVPDLKEESNEELQG